MRSLKGRDKPSIRMGEDHRSTCFISIRKAMNSLHTQPTFSTWALLRVFSRAQPFPLFTYITRGIRVILKILLFQHICIQSCCTNPNYFLHQSKSRSNIATFTYLFYYCYKAYASTLVQPFFFFFFCLCLRITFLKLIPEALGYPQNVTKTFHQRDIFPPMCFPYVTISNT